VQKSWKNLHLLLCREWNLWYDVSWNVFILIQLCSLHRSTGLLQSLIGKKYICEFMLCVSLILHFHCLRIFIQGFLWLSCLPYATDQIVIYHELLKLLPILILYDNFVSDCSAKVDRENIFKSTVGNESLHRISNNNGVAVVVNFVM
jgi:hypothetical protein